MSRSSYFYSTSTQPLAEQERLMREQQQLYLQAMAQRDNPLRNGLNDVYRDLRQVDWQPQEASKPKLNKVLLLLP